MHDLLGTHSSLRTRDKRKVHIRSSKPSGGNCLSNLHRAPLCLQTHTLVPLGLPPGDPHELVVLVLVPERRQVVVCDKVPAGLLDVEQVNRVS